MSDFRDKVKQLEQELAKAQTSIATSSCISGTIILAVAAPIVSFLALYLIKPWFVDEDGGKSERSLKKVIMWTVVLTLITWGCIYGYSVYTGGPKDLSV